MHVNPSRLNALALGALAPNGSENYEIRWPEERAREVASIHAHGSDLGDSVAFELGFRFALHLGAALAADPFGAGNVDELVAGARDEVRRAYNETRTAA